ncbi:MAG TPA: DUF3943 domain-containing protein [Chitinophagaceae bacterium]|nr:DUF3943 domain-containing protein [Chitinophagaceae bacterium]
MKCTCYNTGKQIDNNGSLAPAGKWSGITRQLLQIPLLICISLLPASKAWCLQVPEALHLTMPDSKKVLNTMPALNKHHFVGSSATLLLAEVLPWAVDRYVRKMDYAYISWQTLQSNSKLANWRWDGDGFTTNQFGHPYHGSIFYNSFRANGHNCWQSAAASFVGSYVWETVAENQAPAPNDFINTGFGGLVLGEISHRLANKLTTNHTMGVARQISEAAALIINPANAVTRLMRGQWGHRTPTSVPGDSTDMGFEVDAGLRRIGNSEEASFGWYAHCRMIYGSPFADNSNPFSHFYVNIALGKDDSAALNILTVYGSLMGWKTGSPWLPSLLLTANYDYICNSAFFYSAQSIKLNAYPLLVNTKKLHIEGSIGSGIILLSAAPDKYSTEERNYDYCSGANFHAGISARWGGRLFFNSMWRGGWLKTINGHASHYFLSALTAELGLGLCNGFSFCAEPGYFSLNAHYPHNQTLRNNYPFLRFSLKYSFHTK